MQRISVIFVLAMVAALPACAQSMSKDAFREMMLHLGQLNYWSKAPSALMLSCGTAYPETARPSQDAYLSWQRSNAEINSRVDSTLKQFVPTAAKIMGKSQDDFQILLTRVIDEEVAQRFTRSVNDADRRTLCLHFGKLLDSMLSEDLAKPRVNLAIEALRDYVKYTAQ